MIRDDKLIGAVCAGMWLNLADDSSNQPVKKSESNSAEARRKDLHCMIVNFEVVTTATPQKPTCTLFSNKTLISFCIFRTDVCASCRSDSFSSASKAT